ncbi:hypothetical protein [Xanthomonas phage vB_XooS_NR08]|nr:hypothetical protein [Xanthomonas phage vB_XooS_NR08]
MVDFTCIDCNLVYTKTGRNQKRCKDCGALNQKAAIHAWFVKTGKYTGKGKGSGNKSGEEHPMWNGGESKFVHVLAPAYYKKTRFCERCSVDLLGVAPSFRCVHHRDHNRKNNVESNFELLCKRCHQLEHECWRNFTKPNRQEEGATTIPEGSRDKCPEAHTPILDGDDIV